MTSARGWPKSRLTGPEINLCNRFGEIWNCCSQTSLPGPAWVVLITFCKHLFWARQKGVRIRVKCEKMGRGSKMPKIVRTAYKDCPKPQAQRLFNSALHSQQSGHGRGLQIPLTMGQLFLLMKQSFPPLFGHCNPSSCIKSVAQRNVHEKSAQG